MGDSGGKRSLPIDPALLRIPNGYRETGDPVEGGNPFPEGTAQHDLWTRATQVAEEQVARLKADSLEYVQSVERPQSIDDLLPIARLLAEAQRRMRLREFEIWGARFVQIVLTDADVRAFDDWVVRYADAMLECHAIAMDRFGLEPTTIAGETAALRDGLVGVVLNLKAEARRFLSIREQERAAASTPGSSEPARPVRGKNVASFSRRAEWLERALERRKWTVADLESNGGPVRRTTRRVLAGQLVRDSVLDKIARALSASGTPVRLRDIPED